MASPLQECNFWDDYSNLVKRAWSDDAFKQRLLSDPAAVFNENNMTVPPGMQLKVLEDTANVRHLPLPVNPSGSAQKASAGTANELSSSENATLGSWFCCHTWSSEETQQG